MNNLRFAPPSQQGPLVVVPSSLIPFILQAKNECRSIICRLAKRPNVLFEDEGLSLAESEFDRFAGLGKFNTGAGERKPCAKLSFPYDTLSRAAGRLESYEPHGQYMRHSLNQTYCERPQGPAGYALAENEKRRDLSPLRGGATKTRGMPAQTRLLPGR